MKYILGISAFYHDSAAADLVVMSRRLAAALRALYGSRRRPATAAEAAPARGQWG